jgi:hypothetical protein
MGVSQPPTTTLEVVKHWLRARLMGVINVQSCVITPNNSLVINTWTGVVINLYLLPEVVKTRAIKSILHGATEIGIASLFVVAADLLPQPNTRFEPDEWVLALHALTNERLYAYAVNEQGPYLTQVHFEQVGSSAAHIAKYGPAITFEQVRYLKVSVKPKYIKGDWQIADFGYHAFWRNPYEQKQRRTEYTRPDPRDYKWQSWSQTSWDQEKFQDIPKPNIPIRGRLEQAYTLLEVASDATRDEVKIAYRKMALKVHPDTSTLPGEEAQLKFREITEAYEFIKQQRGW